MIYLDNSATTPPFPEVVDAVSECLRHGFANPSSLHDFGLRAERVVKACRERVAGILGAEAEEIVFTSGGTEANNQAIRGAALAGRRTGRRLITSQVEHSSVLSVFRDLGEQDWDPVFVPVDRQGILDLARFEEELTPDTALVSLMHVNNEMGAVQPVAQVAALLRRYESQALLHVDAVQSVDRIPLDLRSIPIDLLSFSGHKLHAPKGIGVLYIRRGVHCAPLILGGNQENGRRSGTENTPGIAGLHAALGVSAERATRPGVYLKALRSVFLDSLEEALPDTEILGPVGDGAAPHIVAVGVEGAKAEVILHMLEQDRIYVSTGSACSSRANSQSHVLQAMHVPARIADGTLRFSFSVLNTEEEIRTAVERLALHVKRVRRLMRR